MVKEFGRIIVPVDGSKKAKKAAKKAIFLAKSTDIKVVAMYVMDTYNLPSLYDHPDEITYQQIHRLLEKEGNSYLDEIEKMGKEIGLDISRKIVDGHPTEEIIKEARKNDLIVLGHKGKTGLDRLLMGSIAENVMHHASCTVMIVK